MEPWLIGIIVKPIVLLVLLVAIPMPIRMAVERWMKPGKLKDILLSRT